MEKENPINKAFEKMEEEGKTSDKLEIDNTPRKATEEEVEQVIDAVVFDKGFEKEDVENSVRGAYIAVFDEYITGSPGYVGKVILVVYDGAPEQYEAYIKRSKPEKDEPVLERTEQSEGLREDIFSIDEIATLKELLTSIKDQLKSLSSVSLQHLLNKLNNM